MAKYCEKCGRVLYYNDNKQCDICGYETKLVPEEYYNEHDCGVDRNKRDEFFEKYVKSSEVYDEQLHQKMEEETKRKTDQFFNQKKTTSFFSSGVRCPYCSGYNTSKISTGSRMVSVGLFGLGSSKAGKQFHCNSCGGNF